MKIYYYYYYYCCGSRCEDTAVQFLTGRQSRVSAINGQFRHPNWVPELAVVVTVGEPITNILFCLYDHCIYNTENHTISFMFVCERKTPSTFHTHGRRLHCTYWNCSVSLCAVRTVSLCAVRTVSLCAVNKFWESRLIFTYNILHVYIQLSNHGNHIVTVGHDCVGVSDEWKPRIKQRPASEFIKSSEQESIPNTK